MIISVCSTIADQLSDVSEGCDLHLGPGPTWVSGGLLQPMETGVRLSESGSRGAVDPTEDCTAPMAPTTPPCSERNAAPMTPPPVGAKTDEIDNESESSESSHGMGHGRGIDSE